MLIIAGNEVKTEDVAGRHGIKDIQKKILEVMSASSHSHRYPSEEELLFETNMRENIIDASKDLYRSRMRFKVFRDSICNTEYWRRTDEGGFELKEGVSPSDAIMDIFRHGREYGTECATAIVIVFYRAVLNIYGSELFDRGFGSIYLMNWQQAYRDLGVATQRHPDDYFPGDCRYFSNPDVNPLTPEWQGENTIDFGNGEYYGHGIGIMNADGIIRALNQNRVPGSEIPAHLLETATRPNFRMLFNKYTSLLE